MHQPQQFNPLPWAVSVGIIVLCTAAAVSISGSCQPAKFEFFQLLKTELGGCERNDVMPSFDTNTQSEPSGSVSSASKNPRTNLSDTTVVQGTNELDEENPSKLLVPVDFSQIQVDGNYYLTNLIYPERFNAPIHKDKPKYGRVAPVIGALQPNEVFSVKDMVSTFTGYKWIKVKTISTSSETIEGWLPWGTQETPLIEIDT